MFEYGLTSADFEESHSRVAIPYADKILSGKMVVFRTIPDEMPFNPAALEDFPWETGYGEQATSFQLYLQALKPVEFLTDAYRKTGNTEYYDFARGLIHSWHGYAAQNNPDENAELIKQNIYVWDEHAMAMRMITMMFYAVVGSETGALDDEAEQFVKNCIEEHAALILEPAHYLEQHNHGMFQDKALLYAGETYGRQDWSSYALERLQKQWDFLFTPDGACVENSYLYQRVNYEALYKLVHFIQPRYPEASHAMAQLMCKAEDFLGVSLLPDGFTPTFGDSARANAKGFPLINKGSVFEYATNLGAKGIKPHNRLAIYPEAGYFFGREYWSPADAPEAGGRFEDAAWTMFRSGFKSITHRQADDNSFMFYAKGQEVFTDSGLYNYMFRDPMRQYVRSNLAHNTVVVDDTSYDFHDLNGMDVTGIVHHELNETNGCAYIIGVNGLCEGVWHVRHFVFGANSLFILDELFSKDPHTYSQLFHCAPETAVLESSVAHALLQLEEGEWRVRVRQLEVVEGMSVVNGDQPDAKYGWLSRQTNQIQPIDVLKFEKSGSDATFATTVTLEYKNGRPCGTRDWQYDEKLRIVRFVINDQAATFKLRQVKVGKKATEPISSLDDGIASHLREKIKGFVRGMFGQ